MAEEQKHRVLIAEDDTLISGVLSRKLNSAGFETVVPANGQAVLDILETEKFDLMLLDLTMPGVDGFQILAKQKERGSTMPIIVVSNLSQPEDIQKAKELGAWQYVIKANSDPQQMVELVNKCIVEHKC